MQSSLRVVKSESSRLSVEKVVETPAYLTAAVAILHQAFIAQVEGRDAAPLGGAEQGVGGRAAIGRPVEFRLQPRHAGRVVERLAGGDRLQPVPDEKDDPMLRAPVE